MAEKKTFCFKVVDGLELMIDAYLPEHPNGGAVLFYHGGAAILGKREDIMGQDLYLERGYVFLSPDYRLAPEVKLPTLVEDTEDAYRWVMEKGPELLGIDPQRIALSGCSFGGYLSLLLGSRLSPKPACVISLSGYGDLMGKMYAKPDAFYQETEKAYTEEEALAKYAPAPLLGSNDMTRNAIYHRARQHGTWNQVVAGMDPVADFYDLLPYCPVRVMSCDTPPTFIVHGTADTDVSYAQAVQTDAMLQAQGVPHVFISLSCGHGVYGEGADEAMTQSADFLDKYLLKHS